MTNGAGPPDPVESLDWTGNYFNYFTEIEDHFQRARGTGLFLLSPLDWALIENWKDSAIPLEAVLKGIDEAFEKWRSRKIKRRFINSLAYCTQAVMEAAERAPSRLSANPAAEPPFNAEELRGHLKNAADALRQRTEAAFREIAASLDDLAADAERRLQHLEDLERRLSAMEEKVVAALRTLTSDEELYAIRAKLDAELRPYRGKMSADQIALLERRYLDTALLESAKLPRLSLFYLH
jgi:flagellar motility protein MotE (MotC chaperone)